MHLESSHLDGDDYLQCILDKKPGGRVSFSFIDLRNSETVDKRRTLVTILQRTTAMPFRWFSCKFLCFYCSRDFYDCVQLKHHTKTEHEDVKLKNVLRYVVKSQSKVKLDVSEMTCKLCLKPLTDLRHFLQHSKKKHNLEIKEDSLRFIDMFKLKDGSDLACVDCGQSYRFFAPLLQHVHKYHNKLKSVICQHCGKSFVNTSILDSHVKFVHEVPGPCKECGEVCPTAYAMRAHLVTAHKDQNYKCPKCPELLASKYQKRRHLELVHNVNRKEFHCDECSKVFNRHSGLVHHKLRVHSQQKTIACEVCGFKLYNIHALRMHMVKHSDERPFECGYCKKTFQRKKGLDTHVRIHTNDKRYACKLCDKAFVQTTSLKCHMRTHHSGQV